MTSDAPEAPTTVHADGRAALARRVEFVLIGIGGVFIILGWGIGHQEWARALGWLCTGIGFAIEMIYGRRRKAAPKGDAQGPATGTGPVSASEAAPEPTAAVRGQRGDESAL